MNVSAATLRRSTLVSLAVAGLSLWLVLRVTWRRDSFRLLDNFDYRFLALAALLFGLSLLADGLRVTLTTRAAGFALRYRHGLRSVLVGHFVAAITPFLAGGAPLQVYSLYRAGVPSGMATALVLASGLVAQLILVIASVSLALWPSSPLGAEGGLDMGVSILRWLVFLYTIGLGCFFLMIWHAEAGGQRIIGAVGAFVRRRGWVNPIKLDAFTSGLLTFFAELNRAFRDLITRRPRAALAVTGGYTLYFFLFFSIAPALLMGLHTPVPYWEALGLQIPVYLLASILPTPGASGGLEAGMAVAFAGKVPEAALGLFVVGWRLLTYYGHIIAGGIATALLVRSARRSVPAPAPKGRVLRPQTYERN